MEEKILTADQVAQTLQIHPFTVLKFIKQGKLKASKLGRVYRIRSSDVEKFLDDQTRQTDEVKAKQSTKPAKAQTPKVLEASMPTQSTTALPKQKPVDASTTESVTEVVKFEPQTKKDQPAESPQKATSESDHYYLLE